VGGAADEYGDFFSFFFWFVFSAGPTLGGLCCWWTRLHLPLLLEVFFFQEFIFVTRRGGAADEHIYISVYICIYMYILYNIYSHIYNIYIYINTYVFVCVCVCVCRWLSFSFCRWRIFTQFWL
jgi:hypothetical protein